VYYIRTNRGVQGPFPSLKEVQDNLFTRFGIEWTLQSLTDLLRGLQVRSPQSEMAIQLLTLSSASPDGRDRTEIRTQAMQLMQSLLAPSGTLPEADDLIKWARKVEHYLAGEDELPAGTSTTRTGDLYHGPFCDVNSQGEHGDWCWGRLKALGHEADRKPGRAGGLED
jgi:hypothetical protein